MSKVQYVEYRELECRGAVDPAPSEQVEGTLLVGTKPALQFYDGQTQYGEDRVSIFPAFHNGIRSWLRREVWEAAGHYSASGTQEFVISFEAGVKLFLERGVFGFPVPEEVTPQEPDSSVVTDEESYDGSDARPHVPSERVLAARANREERGARPPRRGSNG